MSSSSCPTFRYSLTLATGLALFFTTPVFATGSAPRGARMAAPVAHRAPAVAPQRVVHIAPRVVHAPPRVVHAAPKYVHAAPQFVAPHVVHMAAVQSKPVAMHVRSSGAQPHSHIGPRIIDVPGHHHGRSHRHQKGGFVVVGAVGAPVYASQRAVEYILVERPLTTVYAEPQVIRAPVVCSQPGVHYVGKQGSHGPLPEVIYGLQPPCGATHPAPAPAEIAHGHVRAAY